MKQLLFVLLIAPFLTFSQSLSDLDIKNGYKDLTFDTPFDSLSKITAFTRNTARDPEIKDVKAYSVKDKKYMKIGDISVDPHFYVFDNKLLYIILTVHNWAKHKEEVISMFTSLYGKPSDDKLRDPRYIWDGVICKLSLSESSYYDYGMILIESKINEAKREAKISDDAKKKANDF